MYQNIKKSFNRAAETYLLNSSFQELICKRLIKLLHKETLLKNEIIADFACGVGQSTKKLYTAIMPKKCYGIDVADKLLLKARKNLENYNVQFIEDSFDHKIFEEKTLDLAFSNMGFQWSYNLEHSFSIIRNQLKKNALFAFSMPISGTFQEIKPKYRNDFYKATEIVQSLKEAGFEVVQQCLLSDHQSYNSPYEALQSIKKIGANVRKDTRLSSNNSKTIQINNVFSDKEKTTLTQNIGLFVAK